ncbi:ABC transporter permease [Bosea sp. CS1GBMeth4]|uniref:ABC transporter permease n=1 Tax=Bosea sp. CS1GBMeth4 TaxID=1892849 RepID=UPI0016471910|nr:ABC transporter permease [Bosea sp. CS1GBMeth4]
MSSELAGEQHLRRAAAPHELGLGVLDIARSVWRHRGLVREMARREMTDLHAGQMAGVVWLAVHPILMFAVNAFLFSVVFSVRIGERGPTDYLVYLFSGLAPWILTADVLSRSANVVIANSAIVKKVTFPAEVLVAKTILSSLTVQGLLFACVLIYTSITRGQIQLSFLLLPLLFMLHLCLLWGWALLLASLTPYFRDIPELVRVFVTVNIYLVPIVYLPGMVPKPLQFLISMNPYSYLVWCYQDVIYHGKITSISPWVALSCFSAAMLILGSYVFSRLRHHFSSVV